MLDDGTVCTGYDVAVGDSVLVWLDKNFDKIKCRKVPLD